MATLSWDRLTNKCLLPRRDFQCETELFLSVLLEGSHEGGLVLCSLESSMTKLGAGVDKLKVDLLQDSLLGVDKE